MINDDLVKAAIAILDVKAGLSNSEDNKNIREELSYVYGKVIAKMDAETMQAFINQLTKEQC